MSRPSHGLTRYELLDTSDAGAFYRARRLPQQRDLCLLEISRHLTEYSYEWLVRHQEGRRHVTALTHPGLCRALEYRPAEGYVVREWFPHQSLRALLRARAGAPLPPVESARIVVAVGEALHYLHEKTLGGRPLSLIHRLLNPDQILLGEDGRCKLKGLDMGFFYEQERSHSGPIISTRARLAYLTPEELRGHEPDPQSNMYSLGVIFYELLTGSSPFTGDSDVAVLHAIINAEVEPVRTRNPAAPPALARLCAQAMARDRAERPFRLPPLLRALKDWLRAPTLT
jgi:serine/threonine protein kinase